MARGTPPKKDFYTPDPMVEAEDPALSAPPMPTPQQEQVAGGGIIEQAIAAGAGYNDPAQVRARRQLTIAPADFGGQLSNEAFYPSGGPVVYRSTPGDYGNIPIPLASPLRAPMVALAARGQTLHEKQAALDKQVAQFDPYAGLEKAPPPYQVGMDKFFDEGYNNIVSTWTDAMGSRSAAMREISTPGTEANTQFKTWVRNVNSLTTQGRGLFDKAVAVNAAIDGGQWWTDPKTDDLSRRLESGMLNLSPNNYQDLTSIMDPLETRLNVYGFLDKIGADDMAKQAIAEIQEMPESAGPYDIQKQHKKLGGLREQLIRWITAYEGGKISSDEVREIVEGRYPDDLLIDWRRKPQPSGGSGPGGGGAEKKPPISYAVGVSDVTNPMTDPSMSPTKDALVIDMFDTTGDRTSQMAKRSFIVEGDTRDLYSPQLQYDEQLNAWVIVGRDPSDVDIKRVRDEYAAKAIANTTGATDVEAWIEQEINEKKIGRVRRILASNNTSKLEGYVGYRDPNQMVADKLKAMGRQATAEDVARFMADPVLRQGLKNMLRL